MRLIDADKVNFNEVFIGASDFAKDTRESAQMLIDKQPTVEIVPIANVSFSKEQLQDIVNEKVKEITLDAEKIKREARKEYTTELIEWVNSKYLIDDATKAVLLTHFELEQMKCEKQIKAFNDCEQSYLQSAT